MKTQFTIRRCALVAGSAVALAAPLAGAASASAAVFPLNVQAGLAAGGEAQVTALNTVTNLVVSAGATAGITLNAPNPLLATVIPVPCPAGTVGLMAKVITFGSPISGTINVTAPGATGNAAFSVAIPSVDTGNIGICVTPPSVTTNVSAQAGVTGSVGGLLSVGAGVVGNLAAHL